ncbi:MAG: hypothetical protein ACOYOO_03290 [Saprospiraceae bacterium]|jgi:hypothetical protein
MTLQEMLGYLGEQSGAVAGYFAALPLLALLIGAIDRDRGHIAPWNYLYAGIIYLSAVPGIFALTLNVYLFLFERRSVMDMDLISQALPVLSMILCLAVIRRNVDLAYIPGFEKLSGLLLILTAVIALMWLADRTQVIAFIRMRFEAVLLVFVAIFLMMRWGVRRVLGPSRTSGGQ